MVERTQTTSWLGSRSCGKLISVFGYFKSVGLVKIINNQLLGSWLGA